MKRAKKIISVTMAAVMMSAMVSSCGNKTADNVIQGNSDSQYLIAPEMTELTLFSLSDTKIDDTAVWKRIAELTNIKIKTVSSSSNSDENSAMNVMLMSGDMPDLIFSKNMKSFANQYGPEGAFAPIDELISEETPNLSKQLEKKQVSAFIKNYDGHTYYMCGVNPDTVSSGWFIRQDWLDALGLDAPKNVEEFYEVMKAFREQDPNGNGKKDEVPYLSRFGAVDNLTLLFNVVATWMVDDNGKVYYGPATEKFKTAYENMSKWYAEGLIDAEVYTRGIKSRDKLFGDNVGGIVHDWFASTALYNDNLKNDIPGFKLVAIAPPNEGNKEYTKRDVAITQGVAISATSDKKEYAIKLIDFLFSEEGSKLMNFGLEGEQYDMVDGKPIFKESVLTDPAGVISVLSDAGAGGLAYEQDFDYEVQWMNEEAKKGAEMYINNGYIVSEVLPGLSYTKEEYDRLNEIMTNIDTYRSEKCQQWIFGSDDVTKSFDSYLAEIDRLGLKEAIAIQQKAYDRYISE